MAIRQMLRRSLSSERRSASSGIDVPKGHLAVYVGESERKRFVIPLSYLNHPLFQVCYFKLKKNSGLIIQWVASPFPAVRSYSLISPPS
ncbi:UNVERIFIED_CONTAM: Auxin-responsive protein SAUR24 [Sesamum latifolium]|uniref:Auxin-responsive protein SAUR24 n=1 Tax=Sesamum latifolium TaxID=2727402 RepID=A0AAW2V2Q5_9LAMI